MSTSEIGKFRSPCRSHGSPENNTGKTRAPRLNATKLTGHECVPPRPILPQRSRTRRNVYGTRPCPPRPIPKAARAFCARAARLEHVTSALPGLMHEHLIELLRSRRRIRVGRGRRIRRPGTGHRVSLQQCPLGPAQNHIAARSSYRESDGRAEFSHGIELLDLARR